VHSTLRYGRNVENAKRSGSISASASPTFVHTQNNLLSASNKISGLDHTLPAASVADPCHFRTDSYPQIRTFDERIRIRICAPDLAPDPAIFVSDLQDDN
jgi:hypothetical protein